MGLLVHREHDGVLGRVDVETDDVRELGGKLGIARALEGPDPVRLQVMRGPDALHRTQGDARVPGHRPAGPLRRFAGWLGAGQRHHAADQIGAQRRLAGLAGGIALQAIDPGLGEPPLPALGGGPTDPGAPGDLGDAQPVGRAQDDPSPRDVLLGAVAIGDDRLQTSTILSRDHRADGLSHEPTIAHLPALANRLFASVH